jgi:hypothetical protein
MSNINFSPIDLAVVWCLMPMGAPHEEMGTHSRVGRRFVDVVRALQQIVALSEGEKLSGSRCGKVGAVQGHRPVCWGRRGFQYLAGADKCSGMDRGGSFRPFDYLLAVAVRPMSASMAILQQSPAILGHNFAAMKMPLADFR